MTLRALERFLRERESKWRFDLEQLIETMDVPEMRRDTLVDSNVRWLGRNLRINNSQHENIERAMEIIANLLKDMDG